MEYNKLEFKQDVVYACGDIHGAFGALEFNIKRYDLHSCVIIACGDIGIGFEKEGYYINLFNKIEKTCIDRDVDIVFFRGNHDDPSYYDGEHFTQYTKVHVVKDYTVISMPLAIKPINILCVGGGISVDRTMRREYNAASELKYKMHHKGEDDTNGPKQYYWEGEPPVFNDSILMDIEKDGIKINCVCSHTCPSFAFPIGKDGIKGWLEEDDKLEEDLIKERKVMDDLYIQLIADAHPLRNWIYGHYHSTHFEVIDNTKFQLLDMERDGIIDFREIR